jgi:hypothetical protein
MVREDQDKTVQSEQESGWSSSDFFSSMESDLVLGGNRGSGGVVDLSAPLSSSSNDDSEREW